jgi:hypothetical protein
LASIIYAFREGESPEAIRDNYSTLTLAQVYSAIAFYLNHPEESEAYLRELKSRWAEIERQGQPIGEDLRRRHDASRQSHSIQ